MTITSGAPQFISNGIDDQSTRALDPVQQALPIHLPYFLFLAERGPEDVQYTLGSAMTKLYGAKSFDPRHPYVNHATMLLNTCNANGNLMALRRVVADDAKKAMARLSVEIIASEVPVWERNGDGSYKLDASGQRIDTGTTVPGVKYRWLVTPIADDFSTAVVTAGALEGSDNAQTSSVYPIGDFPASFRGKYGDNIGFRLSAPTIDSSNPANDTVVYDQSAFLYRLQMVERATANSTPVVQRTLTQAQFVEFAFKDGVINSALDTELSFDRIVESAWTDTDTTSGFSPEWGPISGIHLYKENLENALTTFAVAVTGDTEVSDIHMFNMFTAVDVENVPYENVQLVGPEEGGVLLNESTTHYLTGGADGDLSLVTFDQKVGELMENYETDALDLMNTAKHPMSCFWDSGFSLETKKKLFTPMGLRKDFITISATQDVSLPQNSVAEETALAIAIRAAARLHPESFLYGTSCCRAMLVGHSGYLNNSNYTGLLPMTVDLIDKVSKYFGAGDGVMDPSESFDSGENKLVKMLRGVNNTFKNKRTYANDWDAGMIWVQDYDQRSLFYPQFQTVYDNDTSILNSLFNVFIAAELQKVAERTWRDLTPDTKLTIPQFIQKSNELIVARTLNRFDDRVVIEVDTFQTKDDSLRGYSWSCNITMRGNNMKTVGSYTIIAQRREGDE